MPTAETMRNSGLKTIGAAHATELEYVFNMLDSKKAEWTPEDRKTATAMNEYWANFIRTGDPNGAALARWPDYGKTREVMHLDVDSRAVPEEHRDLYIFLESAQEVN